VQRPSARSIPTWTSALSATAPRPAAAAGLPTLADPGYEGAGLGILIPVKQPPSGGELDVNTRTRNAIQRSLRCPGERGFALLNQRWRTLQHITASPSKIGAIARAALVLAPFEYGYLTLTAGTAVHA
jgi:DDE superfamily endonuclease